MDLTANLLLAAGASPAMVSSTDEAEHFARNCADAVLINMGTLDSNAVAAQRLTMAAARDVGKHVVFDPVACGATPYRTAACAAAMSFRPTVVRGNAGEIVALASAAGALVPASSSSRSGSRGGTGGGAALAVRGVDSAMDSLDPAVVEAAEALAHTFGCVVAVTGRVDIITAPRSTCPHLPGRMRVTNGDAMLTCVTAAGCSATALVAAFVAANADGRAERGNHDAAGSQRMAAAAWHATGAALCVFEVAAEIALAGAQHKGPGSLRSGLLDALYLMTREEFMGRAWMSTRFDVF
jgi:hydroxyethylthiazole kinase